MLCKCGCGIVTNLRHGKPNQFLHGHWARIKWRDHPNRSDPTKRFCPKCKRLLPLDRFWKRLGQIGGNCRECIREYQKVWLANKGPGYQRQIRRAQLRRYGLTEEQWQMIFDRQKGVCALCGKKSKKPLLIDHCHATNRLRGLLCRPCNTALGQLGDSAEVLQRVQDYLNNSPPPVSIGITLPLPQDSRIKS